MLLFFERCVDFQCLPEKVSRTPMDIISHIVRTISLDFEIEKDRKIFF